MSRAWNRLLLTLYSLAFLLLSGAGILAGMGMWLGRKRVVDGWVDRFYSDPALCWMVLVVSIVVFLISLRVIWQALWNRQEDRGVDRLTEIGHVRISLQTLENLSVKAACRVRGIRNLTARVRHDGNNASVGIGLKLTVDGETPIQTLSEQLQHTVKNYVEEVAGVDVNQISVYIADTVQPDRTRVRVD
ncbi:alkaline shock response membrane anchor protein AmaP [Salinithrix halophila]|uniref:Alkaline shock response membrane anchor protein AmaP n=1 Tax=Salinithrix halophila TaxID=1485204 RepID=A0ABV8JN75_9BACL